MLEPFIAKNNKMASNSSNYYILRTVMAIEKKTLDLEAIGSGTPYIKFLECSKVYF